MPFLAKGSQRCDLRLTLDGPQLILAINLRLMARGILFIEVKLKPELSQMKPSSVPLKCQCKIAGAVLDPTTGDLMEYRHLMKREEYREVWRKAAAKEFGKLTQGIPGVVEGTNTFFFVPYEAIPNNCLKDARCARICTN
jgi:hypothetical protein